MATKKLTDAQLGLLRSLAKGAYIKHARRGFYLSDMGYFVHRVQSKTVDALLAQGVIEANIVNGYDITDAGRKALEAQPN